MKVNVVTREYEIFSTPSGTVTSCKVQQLQDLFRSKLIKKTTGGRWKVSCTVLVWELYCTHEDRDLIHLWNSGRSTNLRSTGTAYMIEMIAARAHIRKHGVPFQNLGNREFLDLEENLCKFSTFFLIKINRANQFLTDLLCSGDQINRRPKTWSGELEPTYFRKKSTSASITQMHRSHTQNGIPYHWDSTAGEGGWERCEVCC